MNIITIQMQMETVPMRKGCQVQEDVIQYPFTMYIRATAAVMADAIPSRFFIAMTAAVIEKCQVRNMGAIQFAHGIPQMGIMRGMIINIMKCPADKLYTEPTHPIAIQCLAAAEVEKLSVTV